MPAAATAKLSKHYEHLSAPERFTAVIEAMARGDEAEERRLDDACPRATFETDDPAYRRRMSVSFTASAIAAMSLVRDLDALRAVAAVRQVVGLFRRFVAEGAEDAFYAGWYARGASDGRAGEAVEGPGEEDAAAAVGGDGVGDAGNAGGNADEVADRDEGDDGDDTAQLDDDDDDDAVDADLGPTARVELARVREHAGVLLDILLRIVERRDGKHRAVSLLSAWDGFGRLAREGCGVEPLTLLRAWRLLAEDPAAEVRKLYPTARVDEAQAANWHATLAGAWGRQTGAS